MWGEVYKTHLLTRGFECELSGRLLIHSLCMENSQVPALLSVQETEASDRWQLLWRLMVGG